MRARPIPLGAIGLSASRRLAATVHQPTGEPAPVVDIALERTDGRRWCGNVRVELERVSCRACSSGPCRSYLRCDIEPRKAFSGIHAVFSSGGLYPLFRSAGDGTTKAGPGCWVIAIGGSIFGMVLAALTAMLLD